MIEIIETDEEEDENANVQGAIHPSVAVAPQNREHPWTCDRCTLKNRAQALQCDACGQIRALALAQADF